MEKARHIVQELMFENDNFSQWLGIQIIEVGIGTCKLKMKVRSEMLNGFAIAHGAITYALADSSLAFASNSRGKKSLSVETSISHTKKVREGDELFSTVEEQHISSKIGIYQILITTENGEKVAIFKGTVYRTNEDW